MFKRGIWSNPRGIPEINVSAVRRVPKKSNLAILPSMLNGFPSPRVIRANGSRG